MRLRLRLPAVGTIATGGEGGGGGDPVHSVNVVPSSLRRSSCHTPETVFLSLLPETARSESEGWRREEGRVEADN